MGRIGGPLSGGPDKDTEKMTAHRKAEVKRKTKETEVFLKIDLDGSGRHSVDTGIPFFDHMLSLVAHHSSMDLSVRARGDLHVDHHHTVEDVGICLGEGIRKALGEAKGINRYGMALTPMDETLASIALDLSMRPCLVFNVKLRRAKIGTFDLELVEEFFRALCNHGGITLHINLLYGRNSHHRVEAIFKGFGRALKSALSFDPRSPQVPSTKGIL